MKRILYLSQLCAQDDPRRLGPLKDGLVAGTWPALPDEKDIIPELFRHPDIQSTGAAVTVIDTTCEEIPEPDGFSGVIVGGSVGSANDREPWRVALEAWLSRHMDVPLLGICGGHQLFARACGGEVAEMPAPQMGLFPVELSGLPDISGTIPVIQLHGEAVTVPPARARIIGGDGFGIQALMYGELQWTFQFHPEMSAQTAWDAGRRCGVSDWTGIEAACLAGRALLRAWLTRLPVS